MTFEPMELDMKMISTTRHIGFPSPVPAQPVAALTEEDVRRIVREELERARSLKSRGRETR